MFEEREEKNLLHLNRNMMQRTKLNFLTGKKRKIYNYSLTLCFVEAKFTQNHQNFQPGKPT